MAGKPFESQIVFNHVLGLLFADGPGGAGRAGRAGRVAGQLARLVVRQGVVGAAGRGDQAGHDSWAG